MLQYLKQTISGSGRYSESAVLSPSLCQRYALQPAERCHKHAVEPISFVSVALDQRTANAQAPLQLVPVSIGGARSVLGLVEDVLEAFWAAQ